MLGEQTSGVSESRDGLHNTGWEASLDGEAGEVERLRRSGKRRPHSRVGVKRTERGAFSDDLRIMAFPAATLGPILDTHLIEQVGR